MFCLIGTGLTVCPVILQVWKKNKQTNT